MDPFQLTDDLLTGMDDIDAQHRLLFELANQVVDPTTQRGADASFFASLAFLSEYTQYHFASEEMAMKQTAYPEGERHCRLHAEFREHLAEFVERSLEAPSITELRLRLNDAVVGWLTEHILVADKALALHLRLHAGDQPATLPDVDRMVAAGFMDTRVGLPRP